MTSTILGRSAAWRRTVRGLSVAFAVAVAGASAERCRAGMLTLSVDPSSRFNVSGQLDATLVGADPVLGGAPRLQPQAASALTLDAITGNVDLGLTAAPPPAPPQLGTLDLNAVLALVGPSDPILGRYEGTLGFVDVSITELGLAVLADDLFAFDALTSFFDGNDDISAIGPLEVAITSGVLELRVVGGDFDGVEASVDLTGLAPDTTPFTELHRLSLRNQSPYRMSHTFGFDLPVDLSQTPIDGSSMNLSFVGTISATQPQLAAVPEPSSLALLVTGLGFFGFVFRRRKRRTEPAA